MAPYPVATAGLGRNGTLPSLHRPGCSRPNPSTTCGGNTSKDPALAIGDRIAGAQVAKQDLHAAHPRGGVGASRVISSPVPNQDSIVIQGVHLPGKRQGVAGFGEVLRIFWIPQPLTLQPQELDINLHPTHLSSNTPAPHTPCCDTGM